MRPPRTAPLALIVAVCLASAGCKDDDSPTAPTSIAGNTGGAQQVRGTERMFWNQVGDTSRLRFRAYVDERAVDLPSATCSGGTSEAECSSPLPAMNDGMHTIAIVNVASGVESERSAPITLQKASARTAASALRLAWGRSGAVRLEPVIEIDGLEFTADVVATGVAAPAQLAPLPDGRLLVSDADGRVRVIYPGEPERHEAALDSGRLSLQPIGPMGISGHPEFATNRFVYLSLLESARSGELQLRVLRLREVGDALGEAATLFQAPVATGGNAAPGGPRMAFGPDRLLYVTLPPGAQFVNEPAASTPVASMLRLTDEGRVAGEPVSGITSSPLGFSWSAATGALWVMLRGENGEASVTSLDALERARTMGAGAPRIRAREGIGAAAGTLVLHSSADARQVAHALLGTRSDGSRGLARLAVSTGMAESVDRIGDVVAGYDGALFVATQNRRAGDDATVAGSDVVVRLRPVAAAAVR